MVLFEADLGFKRLAYCRQGPRVGLCEFTGFAAAPRDEGKTIRCQLRMTLWIITQCLDQTCVGFLTQAWVNFRRSQDLCRDVAERSRSAHVNHQATRIKKYLCELTG